MPGFDRTGPMGASPMTGGRRGFCSPASAGTVAMYFGGYGYGRGLGSGRAFRGRGWYGIRPRYGVFRGFRWYPSDAAAAYPMSAEDEMDWLKAEAEHLKTSLHSISRRLEELEKPSKDPSQLQR